MLDRLIEERTAIAPGGVLPALELPRAEALARLGRSDDAVAALSATEPLLRRKRARIMLWRMLVARGRIERVSAHREAAERDFAAAREVIAAIAATLPAGPIPELDLVDARAHFLSATAAHFPAIRPLTPLRETKRSFDGLTAREREVAALIGRGMSNRAIAGELSLGERTVASHVTNILGKLGFDSRASVAVWAVEKGLITNQPS